MIFKHLFSKIGFWQFVVLNLCMLMSAAYYNRFATRPDQWRSNQASKQSAYKDFYDTFGSSEAKSSKSDGFLADTSKHSSRPKDLKEMRKEIDHDLSSGVPFLSMSGINSKPKRADQHGGKYAKISVDDDIRKAKSMKFNKKKRSHGGSESAAAADQSFNKMEKKRKRKDSQYSNAY